MGLCQTKDLAIGIVLFNPAKSKKIIENYYEMIKQFNNEKLPFFTLELVYQGQKPEISEAFHIYGKSVMFHKENLYRILEKKIPTKFKKLLFLDADVLFDNPKWYWEISKELNSFEVIQPFNKCFWLDSEKKIILERETVLNMKDKQWNWKYHPGFAWAFQREWYNKVGFFDYAITGSGDTLSAIKWLGKTLPPNFQSLPKPLKKQFELYCNKKPKISFINGSIRHLFHGSRENRQYSERHKILNIEKDILELLFINSEGLFEWNDMKMSEILKNYFISRNDDDNIIVKIFETS